MCKVLEASLKDPGSHSLPNSVKNNILAGFSSQLLYLLIQNISEKDSIIISFFLAPQGMWMLFNDDFF